MKELITFIIVTWNNNDVIIDCIDSIYKFCKNFKIIIVDNNSSDNTVEVVNEKNYNNCKVIELEENLGFAKGNNIALKYVKTPYICYLNPDTILVEDIIIPSVKSIENDKNIGIVACKLLYKNKKLQASTFNFINSKQVYFESFRIGKLFPNFIK